MAGGVVWALCFGREPFLLAPWLALAPLFLLFESPWPARLAFLHGLAFWLTSIPWIRPTLETYGGLSGWLAAPVLLLLAGYLALFHFAFGALGSRLWRRGVFGAGGAIAGAAALWVGLEWLREHLISGFPWNLAAYAAVETPGLLPLASWVGSFGLSFLLVLANGGLALAVVRGRWRVWAWAAALPIVVLAWGARWAAPPAPAAPVGQAPPAAAARDAGVEVRILQPNIAILGEWSPAANRANYRRLIELSLTACGDGGALLVWPESAAWPYSYEDDGFLRRDLRSLAERGCPVLLNTTTRKGERYFNSALLVGTAGPAGRYDKRHLVPYGEYVPAPAKLVPFVGKVARSAGDFAPGDRATPIPWGEESVGTSICFEIIFPGEVAEMVRAGATILATITNDSWYGDSSAPWQHFRAARFRAAENRRPLVRAAITGVSGVIAADGSVVDELGIFEEGWIARRIAGRRDLAPFTRAPWLVPLVCSLFAGFAILLAARSQPR